MEAIPLGIYTKRKTSTKAPTFGRCRVWKSHHRGVFSRWPLRTVTLKLDNFLQVLAVAPSAISSCDMWGASAHFSYHMCRVHEGRGRKQKYQNSFMDPTGKQPFPEDKTQVNQTLRGQWFLNSQGTVKEVTMGVGVGVIVFSNIWQKQPRSLIVLLSLFGFIIWTQSYVWLQ